MKALHSVIVAFSEILRWHTLKFVLIGGIIAIFIWLGVGLLSWDYLVSFGAKVLEYIPFAMVKSNGATMISAFLWFQLVLVTFALVYSILGNFLLRVIEKEKYNKITFLTIFFIAIFWGIVWYFAGGYIHKELLKLLTWLPFETVEKGVASFIAIYILYSGLIVTLLFFASIFSEPLIKEVDKKHFNSKDIPTSKIFNSIGYTIKDTIIYIAFSILLLPILFIPILNIITQIILWVWLYKDTISYDALTLSKSNKNILKNHKGSIYFIIFSAVLFNFIPIFNLISPYFAELAMYHYFKSINK